jgi:hypothetical protein
MQSEPEGKGEFGPPTGWRERRRRLGGLDQRRFKLRRAAWLGQALLRSPALVTSSSPDRHPWRADGHDVPPEQGRRAVVAAAALVAAYAVTLSVGTLLPSLSTNGTLRELLFDALSALNTVGLNSGLTSSDLAWHAKAELMMLKWMGRLEVIAVAVLLAASVGPGRGAGGGAEAGRPDGQPGFPPKG